MISHRNRKCGILCLCEMNVFYKSEVVNLELEVLKMKIIIIFIDLLMATVLFLLEDFLSNQGIQKEVCCFYQEIILD